MQTSSQGIAMIKQFEGLRLTAYQDVGGVWTIGYGITDGVTAGETITADQAVQLLIDALPTYEAAVNDNVTVALTQNQFDALIDFTYNVGGGAFAKSDVCTALNAGNYDTAADFLLKWVIAGGHVQPGLQARRAAERTLFLTPDPVPVPPPAPEPMPALTPVSWWTSVLQFFGLG